MVIRELASGGYDGSLGLADEDLHAAARVNGVEDEYGILEITVGRGRFFVFWKALPALFCCEIYIV
jgi:hypothetical protein